MQWKEERTLKKICFCLFSAVIWAIYTHHVFKREESLKTAAVFMQIHQCVYVCVF